MELRPQELLKEWKAGKFRPVYYLCGEEAALKAEALRELKAAFAADEFNFREFSTLPEDGAPAIVSEAMTLPVFAQRRLVAVTAPRLAAQARTILAEYLKDPLESTTLAIVSDEKRPDPKDALQRSAAASGVLCVFSPLREEEARERLQAAARKAGKTLSEGAAAALVAEAGTDWSILSQEIEKAILFADKSEEITAKHALEVLGYQKSADPFALPRLIQERKSREAVGHLRRLLREARPDEAFPALAQIRGAVFKQLRAKRMLASGLAEAEILRSLRLHHFYDRGFLPQAKALGEARLIRELKSCLETEAALKSKAWLDPRIELERLVVELCGV